MVLKLKSVSLVAAVIHLILVLHVVHGISLSDLEKRHRGGPLLKIVHGTGKGLFVLDETSTNICRYRISKTQLQSLQSQKNVLVSIEQSTDDYILGIPLVGHVTENLPELDVEVASKDAASLVYNTSEDNRRQLLIAVFIKADNAHKHLLFKNFNHSLTCMDRPSWALISYGGYETVLDEMCSHGRSLGLELVRCKLTRNITSLISKFVKNVPPSAGNTIPKPLMFFELLDQVQNFKKIWLLDADIDITNVNLDEFQLFLKTEITDEVTPYVSQPTIRGRTAYQFLKHENIYGTHSDQFMLTSTFVEQMCPIIDSVFFAWFIRNLIVPLVGYIYSLRSDWGMDVVWCNAALFYHQSRFNSSNSFKPCAIYIPGYVIHEDTKELSTEGDPWTSYRAKKMLDIYMNYVPRSWLAEEFTLSKSPDNSVTNFRTRSRDKKKQRREKYSVDVIT